MQVQDEAVSIAITVHAKAVMQLMMIVNSLLYSHVKHDVDYCISDAND